MVRYIQNLFSFVRRQSEFAFFGASTAVGALFILFHQISRRSKMTQLTKSNQDKTKYLLYITIALLFMNFILMFLPFAEIYQPSYSKTVFGVTTYENWYTQSAPMVMFISPVFFTGIPYLCSIISIAASLKNRNSKNNFLKIKNNTVDKPIRFFWLKFGAIANAIEMLSVYLMLQNGVKYLEKYGAYCRLTFFGVLNVLCTAAFIVSLFALSRHTKSMFVLVNKTQISTNDIQQVNENQTKENM